MPQQPAEVIEVIEAAPEPVDDFAEDLAKVQETAEAADDLWDDI